MDLTKLITIAEANEVKPIANLTQEQLKELQTALSFLGYPAGDIDGLYGPKTRNAWAEFKTDVFQGNPELIGKGSVEKLQEKIKDLGSDKMHDFTTKQGTIDAIKWECQAQKIGLKTQIAYVLATTEWETAQTFKPVREAFWHDEDWRRNHFRYFPYYGRGYVQLTWKSNYAKYSNILGIDLVNNPDLAMTPNIALFVIVHGFKIGTFTGRKITDYINESKTDFINARRCINGLDKADAIAKLAQKYLATL